MTTTNEAAAAATTEGKTGGDAGDANAGKKAVGGDGTADGGDAGDGAAGGKKAPGKTSHDAEIYRPEGVPDHLIGTTDRETIDKTLAAYKGARQELGKKGHKAPETVDGYALNLPEELKGKVIVADKDGKDPIFESLKPTLHELGLSNDGANKLTTELYKAVAKQIDANAAAAANDPNAADFSFKSIGGAANAKPLQDAAEAWIVGQKETLGLDDADVQELKYLTQHSQGLKVLNKMRKLTSEKPIPLNSSGSGSTEAVSQVEIEEMMNDQRYIDGDDSWHNLVREKIALKQKQQGGAK